MSQPSVQEPSAAASAAVLAARQRLDRLEMYLREDPDNAALAIEAFEAALACGAWDRAASHLERRHAPGGDALGWMLREGDYWLAQQRFDKARTVLEELTQVADAPPELAAVLLHNLAYIDFRQGDLAACVARLAPAVETTLAQPAGVPALQQLWLRALHHGNQLARALAWIDAVEQQGALEPGAAGLASLIALDNGDFVSAQRWSDFCLAHLTPDDRPLEALLTQASLALAKHDAARARHFSQAALRCSPLDGRSWSSLGFVELLVNDLPAAQLAFQRALANMPTHIGTWHGLGWTELLQGNLAAAHTSFEQALALDPNFAESHGGLAVVLTLQQHKVPATRHAELALRLDRTNVSGRYASALLSGEVRQKEDLLRLAKRLLGDRAMPLGGQLDDWLPAANGSDADPVKPPKSGD